MELGEALLAGLGSTDAADALEPLLSENASFQHHPLPTITGKSAVLRVVRCLTTSMQWSLVERHTALADDQSFVCERTECLRLLGLDLHMRGTLIVKCDAGYIQSVTDYLDLTHCVAAFLRAVIFKLLAGFRKVRFLSH